MDSIYSSLLPTRSSISPSEIKNEQTPPVPNPSPSSNSILLINTLLLSLSLFFPVYIYLLNPDGYSGIKTFSAVDALYFSINTLCTVGYGDLTPLTSLAKILSCAFILVGFGIIHPFLTSAVDQFLDAEESSMLATARTRGLARKYYPKNYFFDFDNGRMHTSLKVIIAVGVVVLCIGAGTLALYFLEGFDLIDSFYLSVVSVTTVGYGSRAFKTLSGRIFASIWLLISTLAFARSFLFLVKASLNKRHQLIAKDLIVEDISAPNISRNVSVREENENRQNMVFSRSEFMIYKLKEMGETSEEDILKICREFNKLDPNNTGKITLWT